MRSLSLTALLCSVLFSYTDSSHVRGGGIGSSSGSHDLVIDIDYEKRIQELERTVEELQGRLSQCQSNRSDDDDDDGEVPTTSTLELQQHQHVNYTAYDNISSSYTRIYGTPTDTDIPRRLEGEEKDAEKLPIIGICLGSTSKDKKHHGKTGP